MARSKDMEVEDKAGYDSSWEWLVAYRSRSGTGDDDSERVDVHGSTDLVGYRSQQVER